MTYIFLLYVFILLIGWSNSLNVGCNAHATVLRQLDREGFHLTLNSLVEIVVEVESVSKWDNCTVLLKEHISDSFYVSPDQLSDLQRSGITQACTTDKINTEAPQHMSKGFIVHAYSEMQKSQNLIHTHLSIPIHLRYQKPKVNGDFSTAQLKAPVLFIRCQNIECKNLPRSKAPCFLCGQELCSWTKFPFKINSDNFTLTVPIGDLNDLWFVSPATYILTYGGCFYVLITIILFGRE